MEDRRRRIRGRADGRGRGRRSRCRGCRGNRGGGDGARERSWKRGRVGGRERGRAGELVHEDEFVAVDQDAAEGGEAVLLGIAIEGFQLCFRGFAEEDAADGFGGSGRLLAE